MFARRQCKVKNPRRRSEELWQTEVKYRLGKQAPCKDDSDTLGQHERHSRNSPMTSLTSSKDTLGMIEEASVPVLKVQPIPLSPAPVLRLTPSQWPIKEPKTVASTAMASSKQGQSSTGSGW